MAAPWDANTCGGLSAGARCRRGRPSQRARPTIPLPSTAPASSCRPRIPRMRSHLPEPTDAHKRHDAGHQAMHTRMTAPRCFVLFRKSLKSALSSALKSPLTFSPERRPMKARPGTPHGPDASWTERRRVSAPFPPASPCLHG